MCSLKNVKPCSKITPGHLTLRSGTNQAKPKRVQSEKETIKKIFTIRREIDTSRDSLPFLRKPDRGTFDIQVSTLHLTESCLSYIRTQLGKRCVIMLSWKYMDYDKTTTPGEPCRGSKVVIDTIFNYKIHVDEEFVDFMKHKKLVFELYASNQEKQICLGKGRTTLDHILDNPEIKHKLIVEIFDFYKARQAGRQAKASAKAEVVFKLTCDNNLLSGLVKKPNIEPAKSFVQDLMNLRSLFQIETHASKGDDAKDHDTVMPTESEINNFEEALDLVLTRNKALRTTQSEISTELKDRTHWLREEANWQRTLQEHAILKGEDPDGVRWRQWRDETTANVSIRTYVPFPPRYKPEITITLANMMLFEDSPPMTNVNMTQFYIEYSFLGREGPGMETPYSLQKSNDTIEFNFVRKFPIDLSINQAECYELAQFIKNADNLIFNVISEPEEDPTVPIQCCELIGYCKVKLCDVAQLETNSAAYWFDIVNCVEQDEVIGYLKIQIDGIQVMRRTALKMLAPASYDLIQ